MHRFFIPPALFSSSPVELPEAVAHQVTQVLRLKTGQSVILLDNQGWEYEARLLAVEKHAARVELVARHAARPDPAPRLALYVCLTQREKFELILQKCTELGAAEFIPLISSRSLVQNAGEARRKLSRWQQIVQEAAEQCGRGRIPVISPVLAWEEMLQAEPGRHELALLAWEKEHSLSLKAALTQAQQPASLGVLIGPEGGLSAAEAAQAQAAGFRAVSLGAQVLRMETAAITAAANIFFHYTK